MSQSNTARVSPHGLAAEHRLPTARPEQVLRGIAAGNESLLRSWLAPGLAGDQRVPCASTGSLSAATGTLVRLAALLAVGASTTSLRWAVESATQAGAQDDELVDVLATMAATVGSARVVAAAPRLALAIGYDIEIEGCDGY